MKILDQQGDQGNDGLVEYLRILAMLQLKRPMKELKTAICLSSQSWKAMRKGSRRRVKLNMNRKSQTKQKKMKCYFKNVTRWKPREDQEWDGQITLS
jgi:hypothetical protein